MTKVIEFWVGFNDSLCRDALAIVGTAHGSMGEVTNNRSSLDVVTTSRKFEISGSSCIQPVCDSCQNGSIFSNGGWN